MCCCPTRAFCMHWNSDYWKESCLFNNVGVSAAINILDLNCTRCIMDLAQIICWQICNSDVFEIFLMWCELNLPHGDNPRVTVWNQMWHSSYKSNIQTFFHLKEFWIKITNHQICSCYYNNINPFFFEMPQVLFSNHIINIHSHFVKITGSKWRSKNWMGKILSSLFLYCNFALSDLKQWQK